MPIVRVADGDIVSVASDNDQTRQSVISKTNHPSNKFAKQSQEILILTSGGADGAFGAGALASWTAAGHRPRFDIVSGVSSGALQAPFAFLGPDYDPLLGHFFTTTKTKDILVFNNVSGLLGSGLYGTDPLRQKLLAFFDNALLDKIAQEHQAGRRLYVTTTDLTFGRSYVWDMGSIAASSDSDRQTRFVSILLASTAVPGLIDPVLISRGSNSNVQTHGDGGVNVPVPLYQFMFTNTSKKPHVTVIVNGHNSAVAATKADSTSFLPLANRAVSLLLRRLLHISTEQARTLAKQNNATIRIISLPVSIPEARNSFDFKPKEMRKLFEAGRNVPESQWR